MKKEYWIVLMDREPLVQENDRLWVAATTKSFVPLLSKKQAFNLRRRIKRKFKKHIQNQNFQQRDVKFLNIKSDNHVQ